MDENNPTNANGEQTAQTPAATQPQTSTPAITAQASGKKKWKITVDRNLCIGAASCVALAMKTFQLDAENKAVVMEGEGDPPESVKLAAESCPTKAIILIDEVTGKQEYP